MNELQTASQIAAGTLPSPQQFGNSWYWNIRVSGTGAAWRESMNEYVWREPENWLSETMCERATGLPILVDHPEGGTLNSAEFAARCVGITVLAYVKDEELWAVARILDNGANELLASGAYRDTSPAVVFAPSTGVRLEVGGYWLNPIRYSLITCVLPRKVCGAGTGRLALRTV
jgi:colicin import membrane protein